MTPNHDTRPHPETFHEGVTRYHYSALDSERCADPASLARYTARFIDGNDDGETFIWDAEITDTTTGVTIAVRYHSECFGNSYEVDWKHADTLREFERVAGLAFPDAKDSLPTDCATQMLLYVADVS